MSKFIRKIAIFGVFSSFVYIIGLLIWGCIPYSYIGSNFLYRQGAYGHLNIRVKEIPDYGEVDVLFVGSSRIYRGIDPRIFEKKGVKIFVLGSSSQTPMQSYVLLKRYVDSLKPALVLFDLLPNAFAIQGVESTLDLLANDQIDYLSLELAINQNDLMVWNTLIYASLMQQLGIHEQFEERVHKPEENDKYISGGYVYKDLLCKQVDICNKPKSQKWPEPIALQLEYFQMIKELLDAKNIELAFINMPIAHYDCYKNNDILSELICKDATYYNFNEMLEFDHSDHFYDEYHLNYNGVSKLNNYILNNDLFQHH